MPRNESKAKAVKKAVRATLRRPAKGAKEVPVEELEKESRRASRNGRKAPQKIL